MELVREMLQGSTTLPESLNNYTFTREQINKIKNNSNNHNMFISFINNSARDVFLENTRAIGLDVRIASTNIEFDPEAFL